MLTISDLKVSYGAIEALKGISLEVNNGEIVALIGSNGAGKTTLMRTISGLVRAKSGSIQFGDQDLTKMPPHKIVQMGISHVPEGRHVFAKLSVQKNLMLGATLRTNNKEVQRDLEHVFELFPVLKERRNQLAGTLSGGEQQMLAVGRALMTKGKILLLDEPSMGLAPMIVKNIFKIIKDINDQGLTVLLVEQNANMALNIAHRAYVIETGEITLTGTGKELLGSEKVQQAYLGI